MAQMLASCGQAKIQSSEAPVRIAQARELLGKLPQDGSSSKYSVNFAMGFLPAIFGSVSSRSRYLVHRQPGGRIRVRSRPSTYPFFTSHTDYRALLRRHSVEFQTLSKTPSKTPAADRVELQRSRFSQRQRERRSARAESGSEPIPLSTPGFRDDQIPCRARPNCGLCFPFSTQFMIAP